MTPPYNGKLFSEAFLKRIDAIIRKLQEPQQAVLAQDRSKKEDLTLQLHGALGQSSGGECTPLDYTSTPSVIKVVAQAPEGEPLSLDEINDIVHEVRRQCKAQ
jgi:hypothetical protein